MNEDVYKFLLDAVIVIPTVIIGFAVALIYFLSTFAIPVYVITVVYHISKFILKF